MRTARKALAFAAIYVCLSLGMEAALIVGLGWRVPQDNARLAPLILTLPPILTALLAGYRRPRAFITVAVLTTALTVAVTLCVTKLTGISTGLAEPIVNRSVAGFLAAIITSTVIQPVPPSDPVR